MRRLGAVVIGNIREYKGGSASRRSLGCAVALLVVAVLASGTILSMSEGMPSVPALSMVEISEMADSGPVTLNGTVAVAVFGTGGGTYAVVAAAHEDGVQIIDVTDPSNPVGTGSITDGAGTALDGAYDVAVFGTGGGTYAVVAAVVDDGVQIIDVTDPSNPVGTGSITDGAGTALDGASAVAVFGTGGGTYAAVASYREGVQIIDVTDPSNPVATAAIFDDDAALLDNARGVDAFRVGGSTYVAVTSRDDSSLGVVNVTDPAHPVLISGIRDDGSAATLLEGARGVDTFVTGGSTYAVVAAHGDSGLQLVDIADPSDPSPISSVADGPTLLLKGAASVTTVNIGSAVYALAVSMFESGVQAVDVTDPSNPVPIHVQGAAAPALNGTARDVAVFGMGGAVYAAVATGFFDNSLRILEVVPDASLGVHTPAPRPVPVSAAYHPHVGTVTVVFDGQLGPAVHADRLLVREAGGEETGLSLSGRPAVEGAVLTIALNAGRSGTIGTMASPVLDIGEGAVYDMYGNPVRAAAGLTVEVPDTTPPEIVSATYDNSTGRLSMIFSEPLNHTATDHSGLAVLGSSGNITLAAVADGVVLDDDAIAATLGPDQRGMVGASPALRVSGGAVADGSGNQIEPVTVPVRLTANVPPTVDAGPDLAIPEGAIVSLNGTATDMDGDALTYRWSHGPALAVSFDDPASPSVSFRAPQVNVTTNTTLTLAVSDGNATVSDSLVLTVSDVPDNHPSEEAAASLNGTDLAVDTTPPVITLVGAAEVQLAKGATYTEPGYTAADNMDGNVTGMVVVSGSVNTDAVGSYTLSYDVADRAGNAAVTQNRTVTVAADDIPPVITLKGQQTMSVEGRTAYVEPGYTATDNIDGDITDMVVVAGTVNTAVLDTYTLSYDVSDSSGNAAAHNRTVMVVDTTPPVITLVGAAEVQLAKGATYTEPGYAAADNMDGNVTGMVVVSGSVNTDAVGSYTLSYDVADRAGNAAVTQNRTVTVAADDIPPVITLKGQQTMSVEGRTAYVEPGYAATDNIDGDITDMVVVAGTVNTAILGTYTLSYDVSDSSGNAATHNRTVMVVDTTPPVITLVGAAEVQLAKGATYTEPGYTAADSMDGNVTGRVVVAGSVDVDTLGTYTVSYEIKDGAGNAATEVRTVTVVPDTVPPAITLSGGSSITLPMGPTFTDPGYAATDNIDGEITGRVSITGAVNPLIPGTYAISYGVTDSSGNTERKTRTVTVSPPTDTASYCDGMTLAQLMASGRYNIINKMFSSESSIAGTNAADLIIAGDNGPTIEGRGGDDCIIGGAGADTLLGLGGDDMIFGNGGDDTIRGGAGHDRLWGQGGADTIYGGQNGDTMYGGAGHDTMYGGAGADTMYGGAGADTMYGGAGHDQMWGLGGSDTIYGDAGDDTLYGGPGTDTLYGGPGTDAIESGENDTVYDDDDDSSGEG